MLKKFIKKSMQSKVSISVLSVGVVILGAVMFLNNTDSVDNIKNRNISVASDSVGEKKEVVVENETSKDVVKADDKEVAVTKSSTDETKETVEVEPKEVVENAPVENSPVVVVKAPIVVKKPVVVVNAPVVVKKSVVVVKAPVVVKKPVVVVKPPVVVKKPVVVVKPVVQNYNEVTSIECLRQGDLVTTENPYVSARIKKFNTTTISGTLVTLMRTTSSHLASDILNLNDAKNIWVGKYVGNKYKVKSLRYQEVVLPCKEVEETEEHYLGRVKAKGLMNYKPSSSIRFDEYSIMEKEGDRSNDTVVRLTIEMVNK